MSFRVLCTADCHIGRASAIDCEGVEGEFSALGAWERLVEAAIEGKARAVVIAGDFYDSLPAQYESRPRVRRGLERLREREIRVLAVAGNHDHEALGAFAYSCGGLVRVFSAERWEAEEIEGVRFVGRSFRKDQERESMLANFDLAANGAPTIGLVHADVDAQSPYGPTPLASFEGRGVGAWVVGHVHAPRVFDRGMVVYPGSPQALDWGETGAHGFYWLEIDGAKRFRLERCACSTVHYQYQEVELGPGESLDGKLEAVARGLREERPELESVRFRVDVRLRGGRREEELVGGAQVVSLGVDAYQVCSTTVVPEIDLEVEARQSDARGQAARLLLGLEARGEANWQRAARELVERVEGQMKEERLKLSLPACEDVVCLKRGSPDEARNAVRRVLEKVLAAEGGGR